jgi:hypothetical protein
MEPLLIHLILEKLFLEMATQPEVQILTEILSIEEGILQT